MTLREKLEQTVNIRVSNYENAEKRKILDLLNRVEMAIYAGKEELTLEDSELTTANFYLRKFYDYSLNEVKPRHPLIEEWVIANKIDFSFTSRTILRFYLCH